MFVIQSQTLLMLLEPSLFLPLVSLPLLSSHLQGHSEIPCHYNLSSMVLSRGRTISFSIVSV